jgi:conjugative relaxase-like TrwC/TraI family protein
MMGQSALDATSDFVFAAPKTVSALMAVSKDQDCQKIIASHRAAVDAAWAQLNTGAIAIGRPGVYVDSRGLRATFAEHFASHSQQPHLHSHVYVDPHVETQNEGSLAPIEYQALLGAWVTAQTRYFVVLENQLTEHLGVRWKTRRDGTRELAGIPRKLLARWSDTECRTELPQRVAHELAGRPGYDSL